MCTITDLNAESRERLKSFIEICEELDLKVRISEDQTCIELIGPDDKIEATRPVSDFLP